MCNMHMHAQRHWGLEFRGKLFKLLKNKTGKNYYLCDGVARLTKIFVSSVKIH